MEFPAYPKVYRLGHRDITDILEGEVVVQEKVDGSQINWTWAEDGALHVKSKGQWQFGGPEGRTEPERLFARAVKTLEQVEKGEFREGLFFRGEVVNAPRHNTLTYGRAPNGHIVLFDVVDVGWNPEKYSDLPAWADALGIESVPTYYTGLWQDIHEMTDFFARPSLLGGPTEGYVIKNYNRFTVDGKPMMGKVVREEFQELHQRAWKKANPTPSDVVQQLIESLNTEARFEKAVQHLAEQGELVNAEQDIGKLMVEVKGDVLSEEAAWIAEKLVAYFMPQIRRGIGRGLPEWYKARLNKESVDA